MSVITLNVNEAKRTLSVSDASAFVVNDKSVDVVRFALLTGFTDIALDEHSALRVMYQRPGETEVRAQTLTYYDTDGIHNFYDWELLAADLAEKGTLTVALCILRADTEVEEWHTTPYQIRVLGSIHTDDSDEGDETITPTVAQRVAILESMIQRVASGAPIVVASTSAMTDTEQIYVLSTDGNWYYHNGSAWVAGGEYGAVATDTTLTQSGIPADAKVVGDEITDLKEDLTNSFSKDLYNKTFNPVLINGEQMTSQGVISENTTYSRTDYIDLEGVPTFQFNTIAAATVGPINAMCFFNAEKVRISGATRNIVGIDINVPQNAKYVMYSGRTARITGAEMTFKNIISPTREIYNELDKKASVSDNFGDVFLNYILPIQNVRGISKYPGNLIDVEECVNNSYVYYNNGNFAYNQSAYFRTGYISVESGKTYKSNVGRNLAWYTSDKVYIDGVYGTGIQQGVTAPENAAFIAFSINKTNDGITTPLDLYFTESDNYNLDVTIDGLVANPSAWVRHKKINWIGDSIVDGADFDEEVCRALEMVKSAEYGINGSTIALKADGTNARHALCLRYTEMSDDADIIAVSCGTNDFEYAWSPIGTIDSIENTTFYGALKTLCEGLISKYPQKLIFFTTPIKRAQPFESGNGGEYTPDGIITTPFSKNKYGKTLGDYADIIKEVCGYYSIPVLDMYRESLLNPHLTAQQDMFDSVYTHPNVTGQKIMARRVAGWLTQLGYNIINLT